MMLDHSLLGLTIFSSRFSKNENLDYTATLVIFAGSRKKRKRKTSPLVSRFIRELNQTNFRITWVNSQFHIWGTDPLWSDS
ncbi:hypothetical protein EUGRSUZ_C02989 [Eucalyptus grandis]|uniref:Uncharacterized protein n=2 Tax=Eucalyptus grandis TaxID=71139 RepID=A0ACC3LIA1_EUCGR|nr:hypothetical protein EUGRSUZ_C02989 [Eucalyptus grandis]